MSFPNHMIPRPKPHQVLLAAIDIGPAGVHLTCPQCGHDEGWVKGLTVTEKRRQPCPKCNNLRTR
jgi:transposase-like protein